MTGRTHPGLLAALLASLAPFAGTQVLAQGAASATAVTEHIAPPLQPMVYTRRLERSLTGDAQIVVERQFAVQFVPMPFGYRLEGRQIAVDVQLPEQLASLAKLERERVENGIFPLELDRQGLIVSGESSPGSPEIDAAFRDVDARLNAMKQEASQKEVLSGFVEAIHAAGSNIISRLPPDLFAPVDTSRTESRAVSLPLSGEGNVSLTFSAQRDAQTGLMRSARREVISAIDGSSRRTIETFTLELKPIDLTQGIMIPSREGA